MQVKSVSKLGWSANKQVKSVSMLAKWDCKLDLLVNMLDLSGSKMKNKPDYWENKQVK